MVEVNPKEAFTLLKKKFRLPNTHSHKGQNGRVLIIGGSSLFHSASIWSAEVASRIVDMVHYSSTDENNEIVRHLKTIFRDGIVIRKEDLLHYVEEDDCILIGPGMLRGEISAEIRQKEIRYEEILTLENEAEYTYALTRHLLRQFPNSQFVLDAGALQTMEPEWLQGLQKKAIVTPHIKEMESLFNCTVPADIGALSKFIQTKAKEYNCIILFKNIIDIITDGDNIYSVTGGNPGLTKGGTGDVLAGLVTAFASTQDPLLSCILSDILLKKSAESLFEKTGHFYNTSDLIHEIGLISREVVFDIY